MVENKRIILANTKGIVSYPMPRFIETPINDDVNKISTLKWILRTLYTQQIKLTMLACCLNDIYTFDSLSIDTKWIMFSVWKDTSRYKDNMTIQIYNKDDEYDGRLLDTYSPYNILPVKRGHIEYEPFFLTNRKKTRTVYLSHWNSMLVKYIKRYNSHPIEGMSFLMKYDSIPHPKYSSMATHFSNGEAY